MTPLSLLSQPVSSLLQTGRITARPDDVSGKDGFTRNLRTAETSAPPAKFAAPVQIVAATTLYEAQSLAQSDPVEDQSAADKFREMMDKPPEELLRDQILKELGYTEEDLAGMDAEQRAKVEEDIRQLLLQKIEQAMREKGLNPDLSTLAPASV